MEEKRCCSFPGLRNFNHVVWDVHPGCLALGGEVVCRNERLAKAPQGSERWPPIKHPELLVRSCFWETENARQL